MECSNCEKKVDLRDSFCSNCGTQILLNDNIKDYDEVSLDWLKYIFHNLDYINKDIDEKSFMATHDTMMNYKVLLYNDVKNIVIQNAYILYTSKFGNKKSLYESVNKSNIVFRLIGTFFITDNFDELGATTHIRLTEKISAKDIIEHIDLYEKIQYDIIEKYNLIKFLK